MTVFKFSDAGKEFRKRRGGTEARDTLYACYEQLTQVLPGNVRRRHKMTSVFTLPLRKTMAM